MASDSYRSDPERAAQLAVYLAMHSQECGMIPSPGLIARVVTATQKAARAAKRQAEYGCNYPVPETRQLALERRQDKQQAALNADLAGMVVAAQRATKAPTVVLGGDPRGPCATLHIPGQRGDGWGDGFAVY